MRVHTLLVGVGGVRGCVARRGSVLYSGGGGGGGGTPIRHIWRRRHLKFMSDPGRFYRRTVAEAAWGTAVKAK